MLKYCDVVLGKATCVWKLWKLGLCPFCVR